MGIKIVPFFHLQYKSGAAELAKVWIPRTKGNLASSLLIALKSEPAKHYPNFGKLAKKLASFL